MLLGHPGIIVISVLSGLLLAACGDGSLMTSISDVDKIFENNRYNSWYLQAQQVLKQRLSLMPELSDPYAKAKNVVLFVGDGMGMSTVTAARILEGQLKGDMGEENTLSFEGFPFTGLAKTYNVNAQTPDSAGTMTAIMTGVKTNIGVLAVDEKGQKSNCDSQKGTELLTALELAEIYGKSTGIITTTRITHATPAATYAKSVDRDWEDNSDMTEAAISSGCQDIAHQLVYSASSLGKRLRQTNIDGLDVVMGGGLRHFLPEVPQISVVNKARALGLTVGNGSRTDGRNLVQEWLQQKPHGHFIQKRAELEALTVKDTGPVMGLFASSHLEYAAVRSRSQSGHRKVTVDQQPSLSEMTAKAIERLSQNPTGFFLMVEAGRIDHGHHSNNAHKALHEVIELSKAVQIAIDQTDPEETLIVVTADHSHVMTMSGYPKRGNPILGKVVLVDESELHLAEDGLPYTTLSYANGSFVQPKNMLRRDLRDIDTQSVDFKQPAYLPLESETHGGEDVPLYVSGPGAWLLSGAYEQHYIFHAMAYTAGLINRVADPIETRRK